MPKRLLPISIFILLFLLLAYFAILINQLLAVKKMADNAKRIDRELFDEAYSKASAINFLIRPLKPALKLNEQSRKYLKNFDDLVNSKELISELLGIDEEKKYLVIMQNNTEIRPSGGFWGSYGLLSIKDGQILSFNTNDSYWIDLANAGKTRGPKEVADLFDDEWRFWNSNWSPDFQESVEQGLSFISMANTNIKIDGVIGPNLFYFLKLLDISGPIEVPGHTFKLTSENFINKMIYEPSDPLVYTHKVNDPAYISSSLDKKSLLGEIGKSILEKIIENGKAKEFVLATAEALEANNLLIYSLDVDAQKEIIGAGWGGKFNLGSDGVAIIDANIGSKLDLIIDKDVSISKCGQNLFEITATYYNPINPDTINSKRPIVYRNLFRLFIPKDFQLVDWSGGLMIPREHLSGEKKALPNLVIVNPGEKITSSFTIRVPENIKDLRLINQIGNKI